MSTDGSGTYSFIDAGTGGIPSWATFTTPATGFRAFRLKSAATNGKTYLSFDKSTVSGASLYKYLSYNESTDEIELHNQNKGLSIDASGAATFSENVTVNSDSNAIGLRVNGRSDGISEINTYANDGTTLLGRIQTRATEMNIGSVTNIPLYLKTNGSTKLTISSGVMWVLEQVAVLRC